MALQPLDLQVMFSQLDKVAKSESAQREGAALQKAMSGEREAQKLTEKLESVNAATDSSADNAEGRGLERLRDRGAQGGHGGHGGKRKENTRYKPGAGDEPQVINDPLIGTHIDLSG